MNKVFAIAGVVIKELYRRKDFYVLLVLTFLLTVALAAINIFNDSTIVRYLKEVCLLLIWISSLVICITTAARQIPAERENRTIFPLLAKPVTRWHVVLGKFVGCWTACGIALVVFYLLFGIGAELRGRSAPATAAASASEAAEHEKHEAAPALIDKDSHDDHDHDGEHHDEHAAAKGSLVVNYIQALWLHWTMLGVVTAMVLLGSVVFAAPSSNSTILFVVVMGILLFGEHLHKVALRMSEPSQTLLSVIYFVIPHLEWNDIRTRVIYDMPPVAWMHCGLATLYAWAYSFLFLYLTWLVFRKKSVTI